MMFTKCRDGVRVLVSYLNVENSEVWESLRYEKRQLKMKEPEVTVIWTVNGNYYGLETFG